MKLTCMRGYSGSGKSTRAAEIAEQTGAFIINRDQLRKMALNDWWTGDSDDEDAITLIEHAAVERLLLGGRDVIVDATHLHPPFLRRWAKLAAQLGAEFEVVDVHADVDECKRRVYHRWGRNMGSDFERYLDPSVVESQAKRWPAEKWPTVTAEKLDVEPVQWVDGLPTAVICDLDGTAAHMTGRSPFDYTRVGEDEPDKALRDILWGLVGRGHYIIYCSGRDDTCRAETFEWLVEHDLPRGLLLMRDTKKDRDAKGNKHPDFLVKHRLFNDNIRGDYNVIAVFDDRLQVCRLWHRLGLRLLRAGDPDADF